MIHRIWRGLKTWRRLSLGPLSLVFKLDRAVRITRGTLRHRGSLRLEGRRSLAHNSSAPLPIVHPSATAQPHNEAGLAVIVGVGPGFGYALARLLAREGFDLVLVARNAGRLEPLVNELHGTGVSAASYGADATSETDVAQLFDHIEHRHGTPVLVVYSLQYTGPGNTIDVELPAFEASWRHNCLGAFLVSRRAARLMSAARQGTIVLVGSTSSLVGRAGHLNLAVGKFGQRALAQVMARELWPLGVHVAHAVVDADIAERAVQESLEPQSDPSHVAESILALHRQPRTAWTSELDLRPWNERFWEHC